jgi:arsenite methyltransferase
VEPAAGPCLERNQAVIYRGPFKKVLDDDGHALERGKRYAVCEKTFQLYQSEAYREYFEFIEPVNEIPFDQAKVFDVCEGDRLRLPRETKGEKYSLTTESSSCCEGDSCC